VVAAWREVHKRFGLTGPVHKRNKGFDFSEIDFQTTQKSKEFMENTQEIKKNMKYFME
jgi:hypothetical protein